MECVGKKIQEAIKGSVFTMREFSSLTGCNTGNLSRLFQGKSSITLSMAIKFRRVFSAEVVSGWLYYQTEYLLWRCENEAEI